jgi:hypothetical protein
VKVRAESCPRARTLFLALHNFPFDKLSVREGQDF